MEKKYLNIEKGKKNISGRVNLFFWMMFVLFSTYEGYFPGGIGELTRYIIILWILYIFMDVKSQIYKICIPQFVLMLWFLYYLSSLMWTSNIEQAKTFVFTIALMVILYVMTQYYTYSDRVCVIINNIYKAVSVSAAVLSVFFYIDIAMGTRRVLYLFGVYIDPNNQVAIVGIGCGLCLYGIFSEVGIKRLYNMIGYIVCTYSIFQCGSRSGILVLATQIIIILLFWHSKKNNLFKESLKWIAIILLSIVALSLMSNYISVDIIDRLFGRGTLSFTNGTEREQIWLKGMGYFKQSPIFGNGWGAYECHNTFLTMLVDIGVLGNVLFYYVLIRLFIKSICTKDTAVLMLLTSAMVPAFFIGAQNKRFFWGALIVSSVLINCKGERHGD